MGSSTHVHLTRRRNSNEDEIDMNEVQRRAHSWEFKRNVMMMLTTMIMVFRIRETIINDLIETE